MNEHEESALSEILWSTLGIAALILLGMVL